MAGAVERACVEQLLLEMDQAFNRKSWHGTNLAGALRGVTPEQAAWRPARGRHNIWELTVHAAYWKYAVRRRLTGEARASFPLEGHNFVPRPVDGTDAEWRADVALLRAEHRALRAAVAALTDAELARVPSGGRATVLFLVTGVVAHDLYHAGQIQLLKRLVPAASR